MKKTIVLVALAAIVSLTFRNAPWENGGSSNADIKTEIWETLGATLKQNAPDHLVTFHPFGRMQSSAWFQNSAWLDVNMFVSGHRNYQQDNTTKKYGEDNWRYVLNDLSKTPVKPTLDGEPSCEDLPQGLHDPMQPYWDASDVRRYAYWSVFGGACGHVYGQNSVRQIHIAGVNKYDTRTGEAYKIGEFNNIGTVRFDPPGTKYNGNDWVLVLDNAAKMFGKPEAVKP